MPLLCSVRARRERVGVFDRPGLEGGAAVVGLGTEPTFPDTSYIDFHLRGGLSFRVPPVLHFRGLFCPIFI